MKLTWSSTPHATQYKVHTQSANLVAEEEDKFVKGTKTTLTKLSPNTTYTLSVSAMNGDVTGPPKTVMVSTRGRSLPRPTITDARLTPDKGTSVKLTWELPKDDKRRGDRWVYGIYYGTNSVDLLSRAKHVVSDGSTSFTVDGLAACESYSFLVAIVGEQARGPFGPPSRQVPVATKAMPGAPPKHLQAQVFEHGGRLSLDIRWDASCPTQSSPLSYLVEIKDMNSPTPEGGSFYKQLTAVSKTQDINLTMTNHVHFGASYNISVYTTAGGPQGSASVAAEAPPIPSPRRLTHHLASSKELEEEAVSADDGFFFLVYWAPAADLPPYLAGQSYSYRLYVSRDHNVTSEDRVIDVDKPPYLLSADELEPGRLYFLAVSLVDSDGYSSPLSALTSVEVPVPAEDLVVSPRGVAGVVVPMIIIVLVLAGALAYYVHRNRRITRSFQVRKWATHVKKKEAFFKFP